MNRYLSVGAVLLTLAGLCLLPALSADAQNGGGWGTVTGKILYEDGAEAPEQVALNVTKDQDHCLAKGPILSEDWVVDPKTRGVRDVFVWLEAADGSALPANPAAGPKDAKITVDQPYCRFEPHAFTIHTSQTLVAKNSAPIAHNFRWAGHPLLNPGGNRLMPPNSEFEVKLSKDKLPISIKCDIHPWMSAYAMVFDHPYHATTDKAGSFTIKGAPAGDYVLVVRHSTGQWLGGAKDKARIPVTIKADGTTEVGPLAIKKAG